MEPNSRKFALAKTYAAAVSFVLVFSLFPALSFAANDTAPALGPTTSTNDTSLPLSAVNASSFSQEKPKTSRVSTSAVTSAAVTPVAVLTIFSDPTTNGTGSSGGDGSSAFGTHAFITIRNVSTGNITMGKFSGIPPGKTMSFGTWGNKTEHKGLWYNLEAYFVYYNSAYPARVSMSYIMTATQLNTLNSAIVNGDSWSLTSNCSSFAAKAWNAVVGSSYAVSAGAPNTPSNLAKSIKAKFPTGYATKAAVPYNYLVYFAKGTGTPLRSTQFK